MAIPSFHYRGKDAHGVSRWVGGWNAPPRWFGLIFFVWGVVAACVAAGLLGYMLVRQAWQQPYLTLLFVSVVHTLVFGGSGAWMLSMRRFILGLSRLNEVSEYLGVDDAAVLRMIADRGIKPRLNVNGNDLYDLTDFVGSTGRG